MAQGNTDLPLTDGKWIIFAYCTVLVSGTEKVLELRKNGTAIQAGFFGNNVSSVWSNICIFDIVEKTQSDTYTLNANVSSSPSSRSRWIAIRLGTAVEVD